MIDFWASALRSPSAWGSGASLEAVGYHIRELRVVGDRGEELAGFGVATIRSLAGGA